jgi:succinate-acetate transporter protein
VWAVWNLFFLIGSLTLNAVYIGIFFTVQLAFTPVAASYFAAADVHAAGSAALAKAGGVFEFLAGLLGYYTVGNLMCQESLNFRFPMGGTSKYFGSKQEAKQ